MGKAAALRDVRHLDAGGALQQFPPRPIEIDVAERGMGRLAEKRQKLPLQRPAGNAGHRGEPVTLQPCPTLACIASSARRTLRGNGVDEMLYCFAIIPGTPNHRICLDWGEKVHFPDNDGANRISVCGVRA